MVIFGEGRRPRLASKCQARVSWAIKHFAKPPIFFDNKHTLWTKLAPWPAVFTVSSRFASDWEVYVKSENVEILLVFLSRESTGVTGVFMLHYWLLYAAETLCSFVTLYSWNCFCGAARFLMCPPPLRLSTKARKGGNDLCASISLTSLLCLLRS